ncbi:MAG: NAD-binding protein [Myxococcales bacterium]|nr:NAD-binding protein [Myxococcales bacterium]
MAAPNRIRTPLRARLRFMLYAARLLAPRVLVLVALLVIGGLSLQWRDPGQNLDFVAACYQVYTQLFFEHSSGLPSDWILRVMYFTVPLVGALVLAEGVLKIGTSLLDFNNHRTAWVHIMADTYRDHIVLIGLGHVGFRVLDELLARGRQVICVESKDGGQFVEEARARGVPLVIGDARRESLLRDLGIEHAACVIACTNDDLANLEVAIDARQINPKIRLVMRFFDQTVAHKLGKAFSVDSTFSTSALAAPIFAAAALDERVLGAYRLGDTVMVSVQVDVDAGSPLVGKTLLDAEQHLDAAVVGLRRKGEPPTHKFRRTDTLAVGDALVCHLSASDIRVVKARALPP